MMPALSHLLVDLEKFVFEELFLFVLRVFFEFERDPGALGEAFHRFNKVEILIFPDERENVAALMTAETMEGLLSGIDVEAGSFLAVKRTECGKTRARAFQGHNRGD